MIDNIVKIYKQRVENQLQTYLSDRKEKLNNAMHYAVFNGGKRIRPTLVYLTGELLNAPLKTLDAPACAIELIHAFSLVHDDLPALDNDDLRRGKPTCHRAFDEATAILAGDALLMLGFEMLSQPSSSLTDNQQIKLVKTLAQASGNQGMTLGQTLDMENAKRLSLDALTHIHHLKTGCLLKASVEMACIAANCSPEKTDLLKQYAESIGLAFQIKDDILEVESTTEALGKSTQSDAANHKITFPALLGLEQAKRECIELYERALYYLELAGLSQTPLAELALYIIDRKN